MARFNIAKSSKKSVKELFEEVFEIFIDSGDYTFSISMDNGDTIILSNNNIGEIIFSDEYIIIKYCYPSITIISYDSISSIQGRQTDAIGKVITGEKTEVNRYKADNEENKKKSRSSSNMFKRFKYV